MGEHMSRQIEDDVRQELGLDKEDEDEGDGSFDDIKRVDGGMSMFSSQNNTMIMRKDSDQNDGNDDTIIQKVLEMDESRSRNGTEMHRLLDESDMRSRNETVIQRVEEN